MLSQDVFFLRRSNLLPWTRTVSGRRMQTHAEETSFQEADIRGCSCGTGGRCQKEGWRDVSLNLFIAMMSIEY